MRPSWPNGRRGVAFLLAALLLGACSSSGTDDATSGADNAADAAAYPVTVSSCGHSATFDEAPKRAVALDVNMVEGMLALGLGDRLVGTFAVGDKTHPIGEDYREEWAAIKHVSDQYPELEPLVALKPDFVFGGWSWGLVEAKNTHPDNLSNYGIDTYVLSESCDWGPAGGTADVVGMELVYTDLRNLGRIFDVADKAEQVVADMKASIAGVQERVAGSTPKKVFLYDSGEATPFTVGGDGVPQDLITLAGGTNIFADLPGSWVESTWEAVVDAQPDCVVLNDYGGASASSGAAYKENFLRTSPITRDLPAVRNDCILTVSFGGLAPGPRNTDTVEAIARWLHPEAFA